jgi:hypothetical protein
VRLCNPYVLARPRTTSTDAPRNPSMLAPSQQKVQENQNKSRKTKEKPFGPWPSLPSAVLVFRRVLSHAETTRKGLSGAVLAHLAEPCLEPREIRRLGCLSGWGRVAFPPWARASGRRPTDRQTGSERNSKAGSDQARMRCTTQFERKVKPRDMQWASPVPDTRGVRNATRTVNAKRRSRPWGSMKRRV